MDVLFHTLAMLAVGIVGALVLVSVLVFGPSLFSLWKNPAGAFIGGRPVEGSSYRASRPPTKLPKVPARGLFRWLRPRHVTGDAINGVGEAERRAPTRVYHHEPGATHPFLAVQLSFVLGIFVFYRRYARYVMQAMVLNFVTRPKQPATPRVRPERSAAEWTARIKEEALRHVDAVGVTPLDRLWVFQGREANVPERYKTLIVLGIAQDPRVVARAPADEAAIEIMAQYNRGSKAVHDLVSWLREQGCDAIGHCGPFAGSLSILPAAIAAGLGELGKHGSVIHPRYGSNIRFAYVAVADVPLVEDGPSVFGVDDFCATCQVCSRACPADAISPIKLLVRGESKWYVHFDACVDYFNDKNGCAICVAVCPYSYDDARQKILRARTSSAA